MRRRRANTPPNNNNDPRRELYGDDLVATPFWKTMDRGKECLKQGRKREALDHFFECIVDLSPTKWTNERYNTLLGIFIIYFSEEEETLTANDVEILETKLVENEEEPFLFRYKPALDLTAILAKRGDFEGCQRFGRRAIELHDELWEKMSSSDAVINKMKVIKAMRPDSGGPPVVCFVQDLVRDLDEKLASVRKVVYLHSQRTATLSGDISSGFNIELVLLNPDKMSDVRFMQFQGHCMMLGLSSSTPVTEEAQHVLTEKFIENEEEPNLFRCQAICSMAQIKWNGGDQAAAAEYRMKARLLMDKTSSEHLTQVTRGLRNNTKKEGSIPCDATVAEFYEDLKEMYLSDSGPKQATQTDNISNREIHNIMVREGMNMKTLSRRMVQGGDDCDFCEKGKEELGVARLQACGRCENAFYCSRECQKMHWRGGHKEACRVEGDIRRGDLMKLRKLKKKEMNLRVVKIVCADPRKEGRWVVSFFDDSTTNMSVASEKLVHVRALG